MAEALVEGGIEGVIEEAVDGLLIWTGETEGISKC